MFLSYFFIVSKRFALALLFSLSLSTINAQENTLLQRDFWKQQPSLKTVANKINEGHNPAELNANAFDPLVYALLENAPLDVLAFLLEQEGNNANKITHDGRTYLFWAAYKNNLPYMEYLLKQGAKTDLIDAHGYSVLNFAASTGVQNPALYTFLITNGANPVIEKNRDGANALLLSLPHLKKPDLAKYFIAKGVSIESTDNEGNNAFYYAAKGGNIEILKWLTTQGIQHKTEGGNAMIAAAGGMRRHSNNVSVFKYLAQIGLSPNVVSKNGNTLLIVYAASGEDLDVFQYFLNNKVALNKANNKGETALSQAVAHNNSSIVNYLLAQKAEVNFKDAKGNTLLYYLVNSFNAKHPEAFEHKFSALQKAGLDASATQANGNTFLHLAAEHNELTLLEKAKTLNLDVNAKNKESLTPLHIAAMKAKNTNVLNYLISQGADVKATTNFGETAYQLAQENEALKNHKIDLNFLKS